MVNPNPPWLPLSVVEVLGAVCLPDLLVETLSGRFQTVKEDDGPMSTEWRTIRGLHPFLSHFAPRVDPVPRFAGLTLLGIDRDGTVHILQLLFSVSVGMHSTARCLFTCLVGMPDKGLPLVVEIPVESFAARRSVRAILQADHISHLEGVTPTVCQSMPCDRAGKILMEGRDLSCQTLIFVTPDGASRFLGQPMINIY